MALIEDGINRTSVTLSSAEALLDYTENQPLDNTEIHLEEGIYNVGMLFLNEVENLTLIADGEVQLISESGEDTILVANNCTNLQLVGLTMGHDVAPELGCTSGVILFYGGKEIKIIDCDLYGCGLIGISSTLTDYAVYSSIIRDCSEAAVSLYDGTAYFENTVFSGNCYRSTQGALFIFGGGETAEFESCTFEENSLATAKIKNWSTSKTVNWIENHCTEDQNGW